jgi:hypothetical protein
VVKAKFNRFQKVIHVILLVNLNSNSLFLSNFLTELNITELKCNTLPLEGNLTYSMMCHYISGDTCAIYIYISEIFRNPNLSVLGDRYNICGNTAPQ